MAKIGVFTCWCGENIARHIDVEKVSKAVESLPGVHCSMHYRYMCSEPGQSLIIDQIKSLGLTGIVVASCSPHMHLKTFRAAAQKAGGEPLPGRNGEYPRTLFLGTLQ